MIVKRPKCDSDHPSYSKFCKECASPLPSPEIPVTKTIETPTEELTRRATFASRNEIIEKLGKGIGYDPGMVVDTGKSNVTIFAYQQLLHGGHGAYMSMLGIWGIGGLFFLVSIWG